LATASAAVSIMRDISSIARALTSGTDMAMAAISCNSAHSACVNVAIVSRKASRRAATELSDRGWRSNASNKRSSKSSRRTTSSLVGK
jgi:hypothetical protein